jgi:tetratricopeptide (TPR) repeat protein
MNRFSRHLGWISLVIVLAVASVASAQSGQRVYTNIIEGRVTGPTNVGVYNAFVELYNNFGVLVAKQRSSGQGRFTFRGMGPGRYVIAVKPYGTNLRETREDVELENQSSSMDLKVVDIRLEEDKRGRDALPSIVGTVFAQDVPQDAQRLYKGAVDALQAPVPSEKALSDLREAIRIFPTYFDALAALGKAHVVQGKYEEGYPYLLRAIDVNAKCADCYYSLALAFHKLERGKAAVMAIDAAAVLQGQLPSVRLLQGTIHRVNNDPVGAEKALLLAKRLYKESNAEVHWQLGLLYNKLNRNKEAADELELYLKTKDGMKEAEKREVRELISKLRTAKPAEAPKTKNPSI